MLMAIHASVRYRQGRLLGSMESLGFDLRSEALLETHTINILKTSEIEGEILNHDQVRSSIARRLGLEVAGLVSSDRHTDGIVEMMLDATQRFREPLTADRLFAWHESLFPTGRSGMYKINTGKWRDDHNGPMQVISGGFGKEKIHFEAPPASDIKIEMQRFLKWLNSDAEPDPVIKAAIAHFWFITIHAFEDGNGRIARAIADMLLARADGSTQRFYSMSAQIQKERKAYYDTLELAQKGTLDITPWLQWFLKCLDSALDATAMLLSKVLSKANFWNKFPEAQFNERQRIMLNKLLDTFDGKLTTAKWAKITKCAHDTALRDIQQLIDKSILTKESTGGRSTSYILNL